MNMTFVMCMQEMITKIYGKNCQVILKWENVKLIL